MYRLQCLVVCFLVYFTIGDASPVSFIKPCKPDDRKCYKASTIAALQPMAAGVPELGIPSSDPVSLGEVNADGPDLKLRFKNMKVTGIKRCVVEDVIRDLGKSTIKLTLTCPISATGQYILNGKLLFITAEGDGDFLISTDKARIEVTLKIKTVESGGIPHWKITGFDYTYDIQDKPIIKLTNLFGGDQKRAKPILQLFDDSSKELITEIGAGIINQLITKVIEHIKILLKKTSVSDLQLS